MSSTSPPVAPFDLHPDAAGFLESLDTAVKKSLAPSTFDGTMVVGVRAPSGAEKWWVGRFSKMKMPTTEMPATCPDTFDACALLGEWAVRGLVVLGHLPDPPGFMEFRGNRDLMQTFLGRYLQQKSALSVRF